MWYIFFERFRRRGIRRDRGVFGHNLIGIYAAKTERATNAEINAKKYLATASGRMEYGINEYANINIPNASMYDITICLLFFRTYNTI